MVGRWHVEFFFSSRRRHTRFKCDWSSDVCSSDLVKLESAAGDIGKECRELERANVERNAHIPQLLLQHCGQQSGGLFGGRLHRQVKADAVTSPIAGVVERLASFLWIVWVCRHVLVVR